MCVRVLCISGVLFLSVVSWLGLLVVSGCLLGSGWSPLKGVVHTKMKFCHRLFTLIVIFNLSCGKFGDDGNQTMGVPMVLCI